MRVLKPESQLETQALSMERCGVQALRSGAATCQQLARCGLLALALRALAATEAPLRALAYDAVALATTAVEAEDFRCAACQTSYVSQPLRASLSTMPVPEQAFGTSARHSVPCRSKPIRMPARGACTDFC